MSYDRVLIILIITIAITTIWYVLRIMTRPNASCRPTSSLGLPFRALNVIGFVIVHKILSNDASSPTP